MPTLSVLDLSPICEGGDAAQALHNSRSLAQHCEKAGYHRYWVAEHNNMKGIASAAHTRQVLSVTHLPQVAAQADVHWEVQKVTDGATTEVQVHRLDQDGRVRAIATMLSASSVTKEAMGQATQLLDND